jgi:hypothetical protein
MALKTFNVDDKAYKTYSKHCKSKGISMSKQIESFIKSEIDKLQDNSLTSPIEKMDLGKIEDKIIKDHSFRKYC